MTAGRSNTATKQDWCTPQAHAKAALDVLGSIGLDPCSNDDSIVPAERVYQLPEDGLALPWDASTIFVNPPYGKDYTRGTTIKDWLAKCSEAGKRGSEVIALVPVATNTSHWKEHVFGSASAVCFFAASRLKFRVDGNENNKGCPMAMSAVYWGSRPGRFHEIYTAHGNVIPMS